MHCTEYSGFKRINKLNGGNLFKIVCNNVRLDCFTIELTYKH